MILRQKLSRAINGYWDGGAKSLLDWEVDEYESRRQGWTIVGSIQANNWFHVEQGKTEKATLGNARRKLGASAKAAGMECEFEYVKE